MRIQGALLAIALATICASSEKEKNFLDRLRKREGLPDDYNDSDHPCNNDCSNEEFMKNDQLREYCLFYCEIATRADPSVFDFDNSHQSTSKSNNDNLLRSKLVESLDDDSDRCDIRCHKNRDQLSSGQLQYCNSYCDNPEDEDEKILAAMGIKSRDDEDYDSLTEELKRERNSRICREECTFPPHKSFIEPCRRNCAEYLDSEVD